MRFGGYCGQAERSSTPSGTPETPTTVSETDTVKTFSSTAASRCTSSPANSWRLWPMAGYLTTCMPSKKVTCRGDYGGSPSSNAVERQKLSLCVLTTWADHKAAAIARGEQYLLN